MPIRMKATSALLGRCPKCWKAGTLQNAYHPWNAIIRSLLTPPAGSGGNCRGRDDHCWSPPAQIRTCAFTHTALTEDEWRRSACQDKDVERGGAESTGSTVG